jgi:membrane protease YdiL (CAAX protease family)
MIRETVSRMPSEQDVIAIPATSRHDPVPLALPLLVLSIPLIGAGALVFCGLIVAGFVLVLYVQGGHDGVVDFYQEQRFDIPLQTQIRATVVSTLYVGLAVATIGAATLRGGRKWASLVAFSPIRGNRKTIASIVGATLAYATIVTLSQDHRVIVSGPTDLVLLGTFAANLVILAPCAEELLFRGWLYTGLRQRIAFWPSFLITTSIFAAIHWDPNHRRIFLVLPLAAAASLLREVTGSIRPTIALHAVYNLIIVVLALYLET